jgi:HK97 gp10 family phage protein
MSVSFEITGATELVDILEKAGPRHSRNLMRAAIHGVASIVAKEAKSNAPKDSGRLRKAIKAKRRKSPPTRPFSDVMVEHGNDAAHDAFYWRFIEYGTEGATGQAARPFIKPAAEKASAEFPKLLQEQFGKKLEKALAREAKRNAKR